VRRPSRHLMMETAATAATASIRMAKRITTGTG
jgi:hypothetical protein